MNGLDGIIFQLRNEVMRAHGFVMGIRDELIPLSNDKDRLLELHDIIDRLNVLYANIDDLIIIRENVPALLSVKDAVVPKINDLVNINDHISELMDLFNNMNNLLALDDIEFDVIDNELSYRLPSGGWTAIYDVTELIPPDGIGLEFQWNDTSLGVKREDEEEFTYIDLKGIDLEFEWDGTKLGIKREDDEHYQYSELKGDKFTFDDFTPEQLEGLKGDKGDRGDKGDVGQKGDKGDKGDQGDTGPQGDSAYQVWLNDGNSGTIEDYLESLKGEKGDQGEKGDTGEQGLPGQVQSVAGRTGNVTLSVNDIESLTGILSDITSDGRLTDSREWSAPTVSEAEAEAGVSTERKAWTAERVRQAIVAFTNAFTSGEKTKLGGIESNATANATDEHLKARNNHTGTQAIGTISGLQNALDSKLNSDHSSVTNSREWTASTVSQSEAQTGTATTRRAWTAQRVRQAITSWWNSVTTKNGPLTISSAGYNEHLTLKRDDLEVSFAPSTGSNSGASPEMRFTAPTAGDVPGWWFDGRVSSKDGYYIDNVRKDNVWDAKAPSNEGNTTRSSSYTLNLSQSDRIDRVTSSSNVTVTVPTNASQAFPVGYWRLIRQAGAGQVTISAASGVTLNGDRKTAKQHTAIMLYKSGTNVWDLFGGVE